MSLTRIDIDDEALETAKKLGGHPTKTAAVAEALRQCNRRLSRAAAYERYFALAQQWDLEGAEADHRSEKENPGGVIGYLVDSSALWRLLRSRRLHELWRPAVLDGEVRSCYPQRSEFLRLARGAEEFEQYADMFAELYADVAVPTDAGQWIGGLQRRAAHTGKHRALSAVDLHVCATAAHHGLTVLHDDGDVATAAGLAVELQERNVHDGPSA